MTIKTDIKTEPPKDPPTASAPQPRAARPKSSIAMPTLGDEQPYQRTEVIAAFHNIVSDIKWDDKRKSFPDLKERFQQFPDWIVSQCETLHPNQFTKACIQLRSQDERSLFARQAMVMTVTELSTIFMMKTYLIRRILTRSLSKLTRNITTCLMLNLTDLVRKAIAAAIIHFCHIPCVATFPIS